MKTLDALAACFEELLKAGLNTLREVNGSALVPRELVTTVQPIPTGGFAPAYREEPQITQLYITCYRRLGALRELSASCIEIQSHDLADRLLVDVVGNRISEGQQTDWILQSCLAPMLHSYVSRTESLEADTVLFKEIVSEMLQLKSMKTWSLRAIAPLSGLRAPATTVEIAPGVSLEPLEADDVARMIGPTFHPGTWMTQRPMSYYWTHGLVVTVERGWHEPFDSSVALKDVEAALLALRLLKPEPVFVSNMYAWPTHRYAPNQGTSISTLYADAISFADRYQLTEEELPTLQRYFAIVRSPPHGDRLRLALRRFTFGRERRRSEDRLLDYWVALEALFMPDTNQELRYRAAVRIACALEVNGPSRLRMFREARDSYDARSKIVHGDTVEGVPAIAAATEVILRRALLRFLAAPEELSTDALTRCSFSPNKTTT